jgi:hypothetical protein
VTLVTTDRAALVTVLDAALSVKVYPTPPPTPVPPCVVIASGSPWMVPDRLGGFQPRVSWKVMVVVRDDANHVAGLESLVESVIGALPTGVRWESVGPPSSLDVGAQGSVMVSEIDITAALS